MNFQFCATNHAERITQRPRGPNLSSIRAKEKKLAPYNYYPRKNLGLDLLNMELL